MHSNYTPAQLLTLSCIAGATPFIGIALSNALPSSLADDNSPSTTVIVDSPQESTVTETVERYRTLPNGDIETYTTTPHTTYTDGNKEPQDENTGKTTNRTPQENDNHVDNRGDYRGGNDNNYHPPTQNYPQPQSPHNNNPTPKNNNQGNNSIDTTNNTTDSPINTNTNTNTGDNTAGNTENTQQNNTTGNNSNGLEGVIEDLIQQQ